MSLNDIRTTANKLSNRDLLLKARDECYRQYIDKQQFDEGAIEEQQWFLFEYIETLKSLRGARKSTERDEYSGEIIGISEKYLQWYEGLDSLATQKYEEKATRAVFNIVDSYKALRKYDKALDALEDLSSKYPALFRQKVVEDFWIYLLRRYPEYELESEKSDSAIIELVKSTEDYGKRWRELKRFVSVLEQSEELRGLAERIRRRCGKIIDVV